MYIEFEADRQKHQLSIRIFSEKALRSDLEKAGPLHTLIAERILEPIPNWYTSDAPCETVTLHPVSGK